MKQYTVLLTDDDIDYLFQVQKKLENSGYKVLSAESRKEAEKIIESVKPDICIFDMMMEEDDSGLILAYHTKRKYPEVPVIIATGVRSETGFSFNQENGSSWIKADLYIEKGIDTELLNHKISKFLK